MFEPGKDYRITMIEDGGRVTSTWHVDEVEGALIKVSSEYEKSPRIINTTSQVFAYAEPYERDPNANLDWEVLLTPPDSFHLDDEPTA